jgi:aspartyl aminopeptidase
MASRKRTDHTETVKQAVQEQGSGTPAQIAAKTGLSTSQVGRALAQMESTGDAKPTDQKGKSGVTTWDTTDKS